MKGLFVASAAALFMCMSALECGTIDCLQAFGIMVVTMPVSLYSFMKSGLME